MTDDLFRILSHLSRLGRCLGGRYDGDTVAQMAESVCEAACDRVGALQRDLLTEIARNRVLAVEVEDLRKELRRAKDSSDFDNSACGCGARAC